MGGEVLVVAAINYNYKPHGVGAAPTPVESHIGARDTIIVGRYHNLIS